MSISVLRGRLPTGLSIGKPFLVICFFSFTGRRCLFRRNQFLWSPQHRAAFCIVLPFPPETGNCLSPRSRNSLPPAAAPVFFGREARLYTPFLLPVAFEILPLRDRNFSVRRRKWLWYDLSGLMVRPFPFSLFPPKEARTPPPDSRIRQFSFLSQQSAFRPPPPPFLVIRETSSSTRAFPFLALRGFFFFLITKARGVCHFPFLRASQFGQHDLRATFRPSPEKSLSYPRSH